MLAWGLDAVLQEVPRVETEVKLCVLSRSVVSGCSATPWTVAHQAPLSMGFSQQEYWSGLPCPPPGGLSHPGIEPEPLMSPALAGGFFTTNATWEAQFKDYSI